MDCTDARSSEAPAQGQPDWLDLVPDGVLLVDARGAIVSFNSSATTLFGYDAGALHGMPISALVPERFRDRHAQWVTRFFETPHVRALGSGLQLTARRRDGSEFPTDIVLKPLPAGTSGEGAAVAVFVRDLSLQKALEAELNRRNTELASTSARISRKNEELQEQYRRMQESNRLKSEFLANMSHELRTPLNAIIGFAEILHDGRVGVLAPDHREYIGDILTSARHLLQLINNVLDLAKVEAGKMEFRPVPVALDRIVAEVRDVVRSLLAQKRLKLDIRIDPALTDIVIDPARLRQVLYNYLSNAIKFTPDHGQISIRALAEGPDRFRLEVDDTGIGMRVEEVAQLFVEFRQIDSTYTKRHDGTGLGLALTRRIVEAQGGQVGVQSRPGQGSCFHAVLPRRPGRAPAERTTPVVPSGAGAPILVVEDDPRDREWIAGILANAGYAVDAATDGSEAIELCRKRAYSAVTLDLLLPDMTGWDLLHAMRLDGPNAGTPAIVLSVVADHAAGSAFAIRDYLTKPAEPADLLAALHRAGVTAPAHRKVVVLDGDDDARARITDVLRRSGYEVFATHDRGEALRQIDRYAPDALVLDLLIDDGKSLSFLAELRSLQSGQQIPVFVCTELQLSREDTQQLQQVARAIMRKDSDAAHQLLSELRIALGQSRHNPPVQEKME